MPTRIIREGILTSEPVNGLSEDAENFYRRLMSVADDYGRYYSHPSILRANCYPLKLDSVSEANVNQRLSDCVAAGLVTIYGEGKKYLQIHKFNQQTRSKSKFPEPDKQTIIKCKSVAKQMSSLDGDGDVIEVENGDGKPKLLLREVFDAWNASDGISKCLVVSDSRRQSIKARFKDAFFREHWRSAILRVSKSEFCKGKNDRQWKADFDWFLQPDVVPKIMEGKYDNRSASLRPAGGNF